MSLTRTCCCGKCFFGIRSASPLDPNFDDFAACLHNTSETLELKIPRPAFSSGQSETAIIDNGSDPANPCPCQGVYKFASVAPASDTIEVDYSHFHYLSGTGRTYTWFYQAAVANALYPPATNGCCGYDGASPNPNDELCVMNSDVLNTCATGYRPFDPVTHGSAYCTVLQRDLITTGIGPARSSSSDAENCDFGDGFFFLQDIANSNPNDFYNHWVWNSITQSVQQVSARTLEQTMLCVVHKEKWWERGYNSLTKPDSEGGSASDRNAATSRTPKYWVFGCSGVPLFSWEIKELSSLTTVQQDKVFESVSNNEPIPEAICDILESDGILKVKDYGRSTGEIIKKTLRSSNFPLTPDVTQYFYARPGGWTFVCQDFAESPSVAITRWPQILRQGRFDPQGDTWGASGCFTGAPIPTNNGTSCVSTKIASPPGFPGECNVCDNPNTFPSTCDPGTTSTCGGTTPDICFIDTIVGNCKGCWIQFVQYQKGTGEGGLGCGGVYDSYLCRVPAVNPACDFGLLPDEIFHEIPYVVSAASRLNALSSAGLCCDGDGSITFGPVQCPGNNPNSPDECDDPTDWGPCIEDPDGPNCGP